jgi:hypothetical protein
MSDEAEGCLYREHTNGPVCAKICDPGHSMCPHHILLAQTKAEANIKKPAAPERRHRTPRGYEQ